MRIGIDVDDVLRDFVDKVLEVFLREHPEVVLSQVVRDWEFTNFSLPREKTMGLIFDTHAEEIYTEARPRPGALGEFERLCIWAKEHGHEIVLATANPGKLKEYTEIWLDSYPIFSGIPVHFETEKQLLDLDYMVDDNPVYIEKFKKATSRLILFGAAWNAGFNYPLRVSSLDDVQYIVGKGLGGVKYDDDQPRTDLIPVQPLLALAKLYRQGCEKYAERNWEMGMNYSRLYGAALRHLFAFWGGEDYDLEGQHHLDSVAFCAFGLREYQFKGTGNDDRPTQEEKE